MFECYIFGKSIKRSNKSISELFDQLNKLNKIYGKSFYFARGTYFYLKDIVKTDSIVKQKKPSPKRKFREENCIVM